MRRWRKGLVVMAMVGLVLSGCSLRSTPSPPQETATPIALPTPTPQRRTSAPAAAWISPQDDPGLADSALGTDVYAVHAPEFLPDLAWLNTNDPPRLADLRGKVVILIFWSYQCIDCVQAFADLTRLQAEFPDDLVVIAIHALKLPPTETADIEQAIVNFGMNAPVINDYDQRLWYSWNVPGLPTLVIIDPIGVIYGFHEGHDVYHTFKPIINLFK